MELKLCDRHGTHRRCKVLIVPFMELKQVAAGDGTAGLAVLIVPFMELKPVCNIHWYRIPAQGGLSVAGRCRCLTKDSNTSIEKEGYIPYSLQA